MLQLRIFFWKFWQLESSSPCISLKSSTLFGRLTHPTPTLFGRLTHILYRHCSADWPTSYIDIVRQTDPHPTSTLSTDWPILHRHCSADWPILHRHCSVDWPILHRHCSADWLSYINIFRQTEPSYIDIVWQTDPSYIDIVR